MTDRNSTSPSPTTEASVYAPKTLRKDLEFLPAAIEILETPPSPLPVALMLTLCALCLISIVWACIGKLDVHAVAWGKIEARGHSKVIQSLDPGKVTAVHVEAGSHVKAGDVLIELDPAEAQADVAASAEELASSRAEMQRRKAAITLVNSLPLATTKLDGGSVEQIKPILFDRNADVEIASDIPASIRQRELAVLSADLRQLRDTLANLDKQMAQKFATRKRLEMSIAYQEALLKTLNQRVGMRQELIRLNVGTKTTLFDAEESLQKSQSQLASDRGQLIETAASLDELVSERVKTISQFVADNQNKLEEAARKADDKREELSKARARLSRTMLTAPIDGMVQQVAVTTVGQVVTTGQQLMTIVPSNAELLVEAYVSNIDIAFVKVGQQAEIKIDAFPFTQYGTVKAKVIQVAHDAVDEQEAKRTMSNATASTTVSAPSGGPDQAPVFVFPVILALEANTVKVDGEPVALTSGMTTTAEIKTDSRRVIDYLFSPIAKVASEAFRER